MAYKNGNRVWNAILWTDEMLEFIHANFYSMTNKELAASLNIKLTSVRTKCYQLGLRRMELEYWTDQQIEFLKDNYQTIGDVELTEIFNATWNKVKGWTKKHIEKKRKQLHLKRTEQQIHDIHQRNVDNDRFLICPVKRWDKIGRAEEGEIRMWRQNTHSNRMVPCIKINGAFIHWNRWAWEQNFGPIPEGMNIVFKDNIPSTDINNLELISNAELSARNSITSSKGLSDNYVACMLSFNDKELRKVLLQNPELIQIKRKQLLLNRTINEHRDNSKKTG